MTRLCLWSIAGFVLTVGESSVYAQRVGWFPGDCFFSSRLRDVSLTQSGILLAHTSITDLEKNDRIESHVGFSCLCIEGADATLEEFAASLSGSSELLDEDSRVICRRVKMYRRKRETEKYFVPPNLTGSRVRFLEDTVSAPWNPQLDNLCSRFCAMESCLSIHQDLVPLQSPGCGTGFLRGRLDWPRR